MQHDERAPRGRVVIDLAQRRLVEQALSRPLVPRQDADVAVQDHETQRTVGHRVPVPALRCGNRSNRCRSPARTGQYSWLPNAAKTGIPAARTGAKSRSNRAQCRSDEPSKTRSPVITTDAG